MSTTDPAISERRSISGVRGPSHVLTPARVRRYAMAYGTVMRELSAGNTLLVGRDTRASGPAMAEAVADGLSATGWDVVDVGVVPTPTNEVFLDALYCRLLPLGSRRGLFERLPEPTPAHLGAICQAMDGGDG